jgi:hypothetical protein
LHWLIFLGNLSATKKPGGDWSVRSGKCESAINCPGLLAILRLFTRGTYYGAGSGHPLCETGLAKSRSRNVLRCFGVGSRWFCVGSALVLRWFCVGSALVLRWFCVALRWLGVALSYLTLEPNS